MLELYLTRSQLSRVAGLDLRNQLVQGLQPDAYLQLGSRQIPIYKNGPFTLARLSAAGGTVGPKMPMPQPELPTQTETTNP
jgi:hypothetical protein